MDEVADTFLSLQIRGVMAPQKEGDSCGVEWPMNIGFSNIRILDIRSVSYSNFRIYSNIGNIPQFPQNEEKGWST